MTENNAAISQERRSKTTTAMKAVFGHDTPRIEHALTVLGFAEEILAHEPGSNEVVIAAAILHDVG
ncbi:MAG: HD domain-containing protein, partial [Phycisphaerae bacterium]|nr:HD domain-containing protein [Phycisphaerae bacterium]